jgi:hypothetical protein
VTFKAKTTKANQDQVSCQCLGYPIIGYIVPGLQQQHLEQAQTPTIPANRCQKPLNLRLVNPFRQCSVGYLNPLINKTPGLIGSNSHIMLPEKVTFRLNEQLMQWSQILR